MASFLQKFQFFRKVTKRLTTDYVLSDGVAKNGLHSNGVETGIQMTLIYHTVILDINLCTSTYWKVVACHLSTRQHSNTIFQFSHCIFLCFQLLPAAWKSNAVTTDNKTLPIVTIGGIENNIRFFTFVYVLKIFIYIFDMMCPVCVCFDMMYSHDLKQQEDFGPFELNSATLTYT